MIFSCCSSSFTRRSEHWSVPRRCVKFMCLGILLQWVVFQVATSFTLENPSPHVQESSLHKHLLHYETLRKSDVSIHVRHQRDIDTGHLTIRTFVMFSTLERNFHLVLKAGSPVLAPGFQAFAVDKHGKHEHIFVDPDDFFMGHLQENESIPVDAHYENGLLCTEIYFPNETYITEPSWRHLPQSSEYDLISYRVSDINWTSMGVLAHPRKIPNIPYLTSSSARKDQNHTYNRSKTKRGASEVKNTCTLKLVADYLFFSLHAMSISVHATQTMVSIIQVANRIFQSTAWNLPGDNWGFVIKQVLVHTEYSSGQKNGPYSYNYMRNKWTIDEKLNSFALDKDISNFCLAHLFTAYSFDDGVVGYAYVGSSSGRGGACSNTLWDLHSLFQAGIVSYYPRTAWTSALIRNEYLPRIQHQLVTAHEMGHNWGASHDDDGACSPNDQHGGRYLMYMYSVRGNHPNNFRFSRCSIDDISRVLEAVSSICFSARSEHSQTCGNWLLDEREQCDSGAYTLQGADPCCTSICTLKENAICSDHSNPCCLNCLPAPAGTICHPNRDLQCKEAARCEYPFPAPIIPGLHFECPGAPSAADGTQCVDGGTCYDGRCVSYCETLGKRLNRLYETCMCEHSATAACMRCCMEVIDNVTNGPCFATDQKLGQGRYCFNGICNKEGVCIPIEGSFMRKLSDFFSNLDFDALGELFKTNLVMIVALLAAIIWIPASCYISRKDKKLMEELSDDYIDIAILMDALRNEDFSLKSNDSSLASQQEDKHNFHEGENKDKNEDGVDDENEDRVDDENEDKNEDESEDKGTRAQRRQI